MARGHSDEAAEYLPRWNGINIEYIYGIVMSVGKKEGEMNIIVGSEVLNLKQLQKKLSGLSQKTGHDYRFEPMVDGDGDNSAGIIGRSIRGEYENRYGSASGYSLIKSSQLADIIKQSNDVINDLKQLGFKNTKEEDLYFYIYSHFQY